MRIIIDGDGCPQAVKKTCEEAANHFNIDLVTVVDMAHYISSSYTVITVEKGRDAVDYKIIEILKNEDIVVTQDYGLASLAMNKARCVIHTNGFIFTERNIENLLQTRYIGQKMRKAGKRTKGPKKRTNNQDENFKNTLFNVIQKHIK